MFRHALWKTSKRGRHATPFRYLHCTTRAPPAHARAFLRHFDQLASPPKLPRRLRRPAPRVPAAPPRARPPLAGSRAAARRDGVRRRAARQGCHPRRHRGGGRERDRRVRAQGLSIPQPHREGRRVPARSGSLPRLRLARVPVGVPRGVRHRPEGPRRRGVVVLRAPHVAEGRARPTRRTRTRAGRSRQRARRWRRPRGAGASPARTTSATLCIRSTRSGSCATCTIASARTTGRASPCPSCGTRKPTPSSRTRARRLFGT
jgi:hypothetical protein